MVMGCLGGVLDHYRVVMGCFRWPWGVFDGYAVAVG